MSDGTGGGDGGTDTNPPTSLDAGAALTLKTGTDTYATLAKQTQGTQIFYSSSPTTPLLPFPSSVTLDIPGAEGGFPAFSNVAFPAIPAEFSFSASSAFNAVSKNTTFSWTGAGPNDSSILFTGSGPGANDKTIFFTCFANDDGNFAFPSTTQSELDAFGFTTGTVPAASRVAFAT